MRDSWQALQLIFINCKERKVLRKGIAMKSHLTTIISRSDRSGKKRRGRGEVEWSVELAADS